MEIILASATELRQRNAELTQLVEQYAEEIVILKNEVAELSAEIDRASSSVDLQWGHNV